MRILFINRMMGVAWGGGENYDYHLAKSLTDRGHEVTFLAGVGGGAPPKFALGIDCVAIPTPYLRQYMYRLAGRLPWLPGIAAEADLRIFMERAKRAILEQIRSRHIDVVQVLALPYLANWLAPKIPVSMRFPGPPAWFQNRLLRQLGAGRQLKMFTHGDAVRHFQERVGAPADEVPPGINRELFRLPTAAERSEARAQLGIAAGEFAIATVGRLIEGKGQDFLLKALRQPLGGRIHVLVAGGGPRQSGLQRIAAERGYPALVRFLGPLSSLAVAQVLRAADLFCLMSSYENFSNAALEAMATGLPVIATDCGGFPRQVQEGRNGHLIALGDEESLRARIRDLMADPSRRSEMAGEAERFSRGFSWEATAAQVEGIYERLNA